MEPIIKERGQRGFTLIEILAVLIVLGIVSAFIVSKVTTTSDTNTAARAGIVKNHLRFAQATAMKRGAVWGVKCDGTYYWLFKTNAPDTAANQVCLPGEGNAKVTLADNLATMTAFTVFFDALGKPYTAYTDAVTNTPVSAANVLTVTLDSLPASAPMTFAVTPETGFMP